MDVETQPPPPQPEQGAPTPTSIPALSRSHRQPCRADADSAVGWLAGKGYFFPLLLLEGLALHVTSVQTIMRREPMKHRCEAAFIVVRLGGYVTVLVVLPPSKAAAFFGVQMGLFGLLLGGAFAPNHTGMPIVPPNEKIDFLRRQVLMSRNIRGGWATASRSEASATRSSTTCSPACPDPTCAVRSNIRDYCANHRVSYTETGLLSAYRIVVQYLSQVGLGAVTRSAARWSCSIGPRAPMGPARGQPVADTSSPRPGRRPSAWSVLTGGARRLLLEALDDRDCRGATETCAGLREMRRFFAFVRIEVPQ